MPTIHQLMPKILDELPAIGKDTRNQVQNFNFRSVDAILDVLNPLLGKYGVYFVPTVMERISEPPRQTRNGGLLYVVNLHVQYRFYGPDGDSVYCSAWGEGSDSGDKATNKAMTAAMKYMLSQVFAIACNDESDADATSPEETVVRQPPPPPGPSPLAGWDSIEQQDEAHKEYAAQAAKLSDEKKQRLKSARATLRLPWPMTAQQFHDFLDYVAPIIRDETEEFGSLDDNQVTAEELSLVQ